jgi:hypothetical protein
MRFDDRNNLDGMQTGKVIHFEIDPLKWKKCKNGSGCFR